MPTSSQFQLIAAEQIRKESAQQKAHRVNVLLALQNFDSRVVMAVIAIRRRNRIKDLETF